MAQKGSGDRASDYADPVVRAIRDENVALVIHRDCIRTNVQIGRDQRESRHEPAASKTTDEAPAHFFTMGSIILQDLVQLPDRNSTGQVKRPRDGKPISIS